MKRSDDDPLPTHRTEIVNCYNAWKHRSRRVIDSNVIEEFTKQKQKHRDESSNVQNNIARNDIVNENIVHVKMENIEGETEI